MSGTCQMMENNHLKSEASISEDSLAQAANDIELLIAKTKAKQSNPTKAEIVEMNWNLGDRIRRELESISSSSARKYFVAELATRLTKEHGNGYNRKSLEQLVRFAKLFPEQKRVIDLAAYLTWSHFKVLLALNSKPKLSFYAALCRLERWTVDRLRTNIKQELFERTEEIKVKKVKKAFKGPYSSA